MPFLVHSGCARRDVVCPDHLLHQLPAHLRQDLHRSSLHLVPRRVEQPLRWEREPICIQRDGHHSASRILLIASGVFTRLDTSFWCRRSFSFSRPCGVATAFQSIPWIGPCRAPADFLLLISSLRLRCRRPVQASVATAASALRWRAEPVDGGARSSHMVSWRGHDPPFGDIARRVQDCRTVAGQSRCPAPSYAPSSIPPVSPSVERLCPLTQLPRRRIAIGPPCRSPSVVLKWRRRCSDRVRRERHRCRFVRCSSCSSAMSRWSRPASRTAPGMTAGGSPPSRE